MDLAHQAPLSMRLFRQEYWSGLPCPPLDIHTYIHIFMCIWKILKIKLRRRRNAEVGSRQKHLRKAGLKMPHGQLTQYQTISASEACSSSIFHLSL